MISIRQYGKKWRIEVNNEVWEAEDRKDMESIVKQLLDLKELKGQLKEKDLE